MWRVEVERGRRSDGSRRREYRTIRGSYSDAQIAAAQMAASMGRSDAYGDSVTLSEWYWGVFRGRPSIRGTVRSPNTLRGYDGEMRRNIEPMLGDVPLSRISHEQVALCVRSSSSPRNTRRTLGAVLRAAYDDGLMPERPMSRRIPVHVERAERHAPWTRFEAMAALEAEWPDPRLSAYLVMGLSGLRKEEALGMRPIDVSETSTYSIVTGEEVESMTMSVRWTYTAEGGHVERLKNDASVRMIPVLVPGRELLRASLAALGESAALGAMDDGERAARRLSWAYGRIVDMDGYAFDWAWRKSLESLGLRPVPPKTLRHTSTTLMETAGVPHDLADRMHGRADHSTAYRNYFREDPALMEDAAMRIGAIMGVVEPPRGPLPGTPRKDDGGSAAMPT